MGRPKLYARAVKLPLTARLAAAAEAVADARARRGLERPLADIYREALALGLHQLAGLEGLHLRWGAEAPEPPLEVGRQAPEGARPFRGAGGALEASRRAAAEPEPEPPGGEPEPERGSAEPEPPRAKVRRPAEAGRPAKAHPEADRIVDELRAAAKREGLSQAALARGIGVEPRTLGRYLKPEGDPARSRPDREVGARALAYLATLTPAS